MGSQDDETLPIRFVANTMQRAIRQVVILSIIFLCGLVALRSYCQAAIGRTNVSTVIKSEFGGVRFAFENTQIFNLPPKKDCLCLVAYRIPVFGGKSKEQYNIALSIRPNIGETPPLNISHFENSDHKGEKIWWLVNNFGEPFLDPSKPRHAPEIISGSIGSACIFIARVLRRRRDGRDGWRYAAASAFAIFGILNLFLVVLSVGSWL
jgi:hypothetical protein